MSSIFIACCVNCQCGNQINEGKHEKREHMVNVYKQLFIAPHDEVGGAPWQGFSFFLDKSLIGSTFERHGVSLYFI